MNLISISQTVVSSFRRQSSYQGTESKIECRSKERRIRADRRKEPRFGDGVERRQQVDRRPV